MLNILKTTSLSTLLWLESKFYSGTLPTMHSIYVHTDMYQGLKSFANSYIYILLQGKECFFKDLLSLAVYFRDPKKYC